MLHLSSKAPITPNANGCKLTHYWCQFLLCAPGLHLWPPGSVGFPGAKQGGRSKRAARNPHSLNPKPSIAHPRPQIETMPCVLRQIRQSNDSPWCETPFLCKAAWSRLTPAVHIGHEGEPENHSERKRFTFRNLRMELTHVVEQTVHRRWGIRYLINASVM